MVNTEKALNWYNSSSEEVRFNIQIKYQLDRDQQITYEKIEEIWNKEITKK